MDDAPPRGQGLGLLHGQRSRRLESEILLRQQLRLGGSGNGLSRASAG